MWKDPKLFRVVRQETDQRKPIFFVFALKCYNKSESSSQRETAKDKRFWSWFFQFLQKPDSEDIDVSVNVRIEHVETGTWLHGSRGKNVGSSGCAWKLSFEEFLQLKLDVIADLPYERKQITVEVNKKTQQTVIRQWDGAQLVQVSFLSFLWGQRTH